MADNDQSDFPAAVEDTLAHSCAIWASLAESIETHIEAAQPKHPDEVSKLMLMAAQAEACRFRSTGEDDAISFDRLNSSRIK